jgi:hypothetical protein
MYSEEPTFEGLGQGLPARWDAVRNFLKTGGRLGHQESLETLAARTNYFRETYAYGAKASIAGIEPFLFHGGFVEAARRLHDRPIVEPAIVFANLLVPGQELAIHTDVPEFRGVNRKRHPQWLIVVMRHSGLFETWRMPIATAVAWFHDCSGGEFVFYPDGPKAPPVAHPVHYTTALLLDTDSVFHGVDRVAESRVPMPDLKPGMRLSFDGDGRWSLSSGNQTLARYAFRDLRFSISWKAYCYADEAEEALVREHRDDLSRAQVLEVLTADLRRRGRIQGETPKSTDLALAIISEYIQYPPPAPSETGSRSTG